MCIFRGADRLTLISFTRRIFRKFAFNLTRIFLNFTGFYFEEDFLGFVKNFSQNILSEFAPQINYFYHKINFSIEDRHLPKI